MQDDSESISQAIPSSPRQELFDRISILFAAEGTKVDTELEELMRPLLDGTMNYEEHCRMLEAMLKDATA